MLVTEGGNQGEEGAKSAYGQLHQCSIQRIPLDTAMITLKTCSCLTQMYYMSRPIRQWANLYPNMFN